MGEHTPGPWRIDGDDCLTTGFPFIAVCAGETGPGFRSVAEVQGVYDDAADGAPLTEESRANARLIAAAPELLESNVEAADFLLATFAQMGNPDGPEGWDDPDAYAVYAKLQAANTKATGGQHD